ncbi:MAG: hypothetical protein FD175_2059 [Beijerinckiaceae bacterium]|nr:MAG: hypothetical protein FD175_2059 [Beijerinckiaceae bacterium]
MANATKTILRRSVLALGLGLAVVATPINLGTAFAYDEGSESAINVDGKGIALRGYDPVAYFTLGKPTPGDAKFTAKHDGATYHFASATTRDAFTREPAKFAPAFGGYCAMGAVFEKKLDGDPNLWKIVDGKLYLNVGEPAQKRWLEDTKGNISKAAVNWPKIRDKAPKEL